MTESFCDCKSEKWIYSNIKPKAWRSTQEEFSLLICNKCGLIKTHPQIPKDQISDYYSSHTYDSHKKKNSKLKFFDTLYHFAQKLNFRHKYSIIKRALYSNTKGHKLLDYGCGNGNFLEFVQEKFYSVKGVEFEKLMIEYCQSKGLDVKSEEEFFLENEKYDVITLFHVLEHLYNPETYLRKFNSLMNHKGILVIALPNPNSFDSNYYKSDWAAWDVPIHVYHFTQGVIIQMAKAAGFKFLFKSPLYLDAFYVSVLSEKVKHTKLPFLRGILIGALSNVAAMISTEYSSLIYVFEKID